MAADYILVDGQPQKVADANGTTAGGDYIGQVHYLCLPDDKGNIHSWSIEACSLNYAYIGDTNNGYGALTDETAFKVIGITNGEANGDSVAINGNSITATKANESKSATLSGGGDNHGLVVTAGETSAHYSYKSISYKGHTYALPDKSASDTLATLSDITLDKALANNGAGGSVVPLKNGGLGVDASTDAGKKTARSNLGLGTAATYDVATGDTIGASTADSSLATTKQIVSYVQNTYQGALSGAVQYLGTVADLNSLGAVQAGYGDFVRAEKGFTIPAGTTTNFSQTVHANDIIYCEGMSSKPTAFPANSDNWTVAHVEQDTKVGANSATSSGYVAASGSTNGKVYGVVGGQPKWATPSSTFTGTKATISSTASYTPAGSVSIAAKKINIDHITGLGSLPTFGVTYDAGTKSLTFNFNQGSLPTKASIAVGSGEAQTATLTGTAATITSSGSYTPAGTIAHSLS